MRVDLRPATWDEVRTMRDRLLRDSDWTQAGDVPHDAATKAAWRAYRQALRDLTKAAGPAGVVWPKRPA